ncbi:hypothetical protein Sru01_65010 [Sphaerisporangium rufum]|uniref:Uncharacterized protein n=1 Tax=Sphaerisporangium rufum TaxID=1381558 RepID=A0A919R8G1_9ACTN|nr:hypothetical protein [Sphaerisporangium rufum]GII81519.1 hypothetical protein Sru01_65010 [Sphaerisporangium rufum]
MKPRRPGRHRDGVPPTETSPRRCWDDDQRTAAAQLDSAEPGWLVFYGVGTRRYYAFALWPATPAQLGATTVQELWHLMRETEMQARTA